MSTLAMARIALMLLAGAAIAQDSQTPTMAFDCWITTGRQQATTHYLVCIVDRDGLPPADEALDPPELIALDTVHRLLHQGELAELDRYVRDNAGVLAPGDLRRIRLFSYPSSWSWDEERPQLLVRMLCPDGYHCPVFIRR